MTSAKSMSFFEKNIRTKMFHLQWRYVEHKNLFLDDIVRIVIPYICLTILEKQVSICFTRY